VFIDILIIPCYIIIQKRGDIVSDRLKYAALCVVIFIFILSGCASQRPSDVNESFGTSSSITETSPDSTTAASGTDIPADTKAISDPEATSGTSDTDILPPGSNTEAPPRNNTSSVSQPPETSTPVVTPPVTSGNTQTPEPQQIAANEISISYSSLKSVNEPSPYIKGTPIYGILYSGSRAQIGDTIVFKLTVSPSNHTDAVFIESSSNISCNISGNTLTVNVKSAGENDIGMITIYASKGAGSRVSAKATVSFAIDRGGNPYNDLPTLLSEYIRLKGMEFAVCPNGYTTADPTLSITGFAGAPAWDDQILKSESNWISRCFWLIDQYASRSFRIVNFIITETSVGFSASK